MPNKKHTGAEMKSLGAPQEDDSSTNSSEFPYPTFVKKKVPLEG